MITMNTTPHLPSPAASPVQRIFRLSTRALAAFPECKLSWSLVADWCREHLLLQHRWSFDARAVDDEMQRVAPELATCLRNDPPAQRRRIMKAIEETHRRSEKLAKEMEQ